MECLKIPPGEIEGSNGLQLYYAGTGYKQNFLRDTIYANYLDPDPEMLRSQLIFSARKQAHEINPQNGAEKWKLAHQVPGFIMPNGKSTEFSACDGAAWFVIGHFLYQELTGDQSLVQRHLNNLLGALSGYAESHINDLGIFFDDPRHCEATEFALKRTDWRDSVTPGRDNDQVVWPASFPLAQALYIKAFRDGYKLFGQSYFEKKAQQLIGGLNGLFDERLGGFCLAKDSLGMVSVANTDSLGMLSFLDWNDISQEQIETIIESSSVLETPIGYIATNPRVKGADDYHFRVWAQDQALIHMGASRFLRLAAENGCDELDKPLEKVKEVSGRIGRVMVGDLSHAWETYVLVDGEIIRKGCEDQLWADSAKRYLIRQGVIRIEPIEDQTLAA